VSVCVCVCVARVLSNSNANEGVEPRYSWTNHTLPITDIYVGHGGCRARVATASRDKSVKVAASSLSEIYLIKPEIKSFAGECNFLHFCLFDDCSAPLSRIVSGATQVTCCECDCDWPVLCRVLANFCISL